MKSTITPSRTIEGYKAQLPKHEPKSDFNHKDYRIVQYVGKSWRYATVPEWSHFDQVQKWGSTIDKNSGKEVIHAIGKANGKCTLLKCEKR